MMTRTVMGEGPQHMFVRFVGNGPEYLRELGVECREDVKVEEVRWGVVTSACLILVVRSVPCEIPKPEAAGDHLLRGRTFSLFSSKSRDGMEPRGSSDTPAA
jgi:hypothetical protein